MFGGVDIRWLYIPVHEYPPEGKAGFTVLMNSVRIVVSLTCNPLVITYR